MIENGKTAFLKIPMERFSYDLEIKTHEKNRKNKRTEIE